MQNTYQFSTNNICLIFEEMLYKQNKLKLKLSVKCTHNDIQRTLMANNSYKQNKILAHI